MAYVRIPTGIEQTRLNHISISLPLVLEVLDLPQSLFGSRHRRVHPAQSLTGMGEDLVAFP